MAREGADGCLTHGEAPTLCPETPEASKQTTFCARHAQSASSPKLQGMRDDPFAGLRGAVPRGDYSFFAPQLLVCHLTHWET